MRMKKFIAKLIIIPMLASLIGVFQFQSPVFAAGIEITEEGTLFSQSLSKAGHHTNNSWQSAGSTSTAMGPYDLRSVLYMTTSVSAKTGSGDWQRSSASATWSDANGTTINGLVGSRIKVADFASTYDLSSCTCTLYASGSTRNLWESSSGYGYMYIGGSYTCTIDELKPKSPSFNSNLTYLDPPQNALFLPKPHHNILIYPIGNYSVFKVRFYQ